MNGQMEGWRDGWILDMDGYGWMGRTDGRTIELMDEWMDHYFLDRRYVQMDERLNTYLFN